MTYRWHFLWAGFLSFTASPLLTMMVLPFFKSSKGVCKKGMLGWWDYWSNAGLAGLFEEQVLEQDQHRQILFLQANSGRQMIGSARTTPQARVAPSLQHFCCSLPLVDLG